LSSIQLDKKEWEAFLEKLSELEKKYMLVLRELDETRGKLQALEAAPKPKKQDSIEQAAPPKVEGAPYGKESAKPSILDRLTSKLESLQTRSLIPAASCSRCGYRISQPTRSCVHCGADFGKMVCSCGRELPERVKFCDHCGRPAETNV